MKVALHVDQLWFRPSGGIGTYVEQLLLRLPKLEGVELTPFFSRWGRRTPSFAPLTTDGRFPGIELPGAIRVLYPAWAYLRRPRLSGELGTADVVHAPNPAAIPPVARHQRLVVTVHDLAHERFPGLYPRRWRALFARGLRIARDEAAAIVVPSAHVRGEVIAAGAEPARVHVTPLASAMAEPDPASRADRDDHGISPPYVLTVGTVEPRKNLPRLVRAYRRVANEGHPLALAIVGPDGWGSAELASELARGRDGRILRAELGTEALAAAYADAEAVAYVSLYEGFGLPILEAMSMGAPVITSTTSALPEVAGDAALLVDPADEDAIADALRRLLTDPALRADLADRGRRRAATFSWDATARATLEVYREVLA